MSAQNIIRNEVIFLFWFHILIKNIFYFSSAAKYHDWENGRRAYNYVITENVKRLLRRNYEMAVLPHVKSGIIEEQVCVIDFCLSSYVKA